MPYSTPTSWVTGLMTLALAAGGATASVTDHFNDNTIGPEWSTVVDNVARLSLAEQNQRLEILASSPISPNTDALYLSNGPSGFLLSTASDFEIKIDFAITNPTAIASTSAGSGSALGLVFGIGRDLPDGTDSAAVGVGLVDTGLGLSVLASTAAQRVDDAQTLFPMASPVASGTFRITYASLTDQLILNNGSVGMVLANLVRSTWNADEVYVSFGARGHGFSIASGQAYFDNFEVVAGTVLPIPEPASFAWVVLAAPLLLRRQAKHDSSVHFWR